MKNKETTIFIISTALAAASMADCSGQSPEPAASAKATQTSPSGHTKTNNSSNDTEPTESHTIMVGTAGTGEPYSMVDDQKNWTGAGADPWAEIETRTGWTIKMRRVSDMAFLFGELNADRVGVATNYFAITEARLETCIASDPIYVGAQVIIVRPGNECKTLDDLHGYTIGMTAGQAAQSAVEDITPDCDWEVVAYRDSNVGFQGCSLGRIDCYANTVTNIGKAERTRNLGFRMLDQELFENNVGRWFVDTEKGAGLRDDINVVLKEMHEDGTISEIITKWFYKGLSQLISDEWLTATH